MHRTRRRKVTNRVEYHHRKSASPTRPPPLFAVIMDETAIVHHKLRIPTKSAMIFGEELPDLAKLTVTNAHRPWQVQLQKNEENIIWLIDGLEEFIKYYSIHLGSILQFIYQGNSVFSVRICDALGSEIEYPIFSAPKFEAHNGEDTPSDDLSVEIVSSKPQIFQGSFVKQEEDIRLDDQSVEILDVKPPISDGSSKQKRLNRVIKQESFEKSSENVSNRRGRGKRRKQGRKAASMDHQALSNFWYRTRSISRIKEEQAEVQELGNANISDRSKPKENNHASCSRNSPVKHEDIEIIVPRSFSYSESRRPPMSKETEKAVRAAFRCNVQNPYIMRRSALDVPTEFVRRHMRWCSEMIELQAGNEKQKWPVRCYPIYTNGGSSSMKRMGQGWGLFSRSKNLQEGDVCVFEMISKIEGIVLSVWIYRAADYAKPPQKRPRAK